MSDWQSIESAPEGREVLVGRWAGDAVFDNDYEQVGWARPPEWQVAVSHTNTMFQKGEPLGGRPTHWQPIPCGPMPDFPTLPSPATPPECSKTMNLDSNVSA